MFLFLLVGLSNCWTFSVSQTYGFVNSNSTAVNSSLEAVDLFGLSNGGSAALVQTTLGSFQLYHPLNDTFEPLSYPESIIALSNTDQDLVLIQLLNGEFYFSTSTVNVSLPVDTIQQGVLISTSSGYHTLGENNSILYLIDIYLNGTVHLNPLSTPTLGVYANVDVVTLLQWTAVDFLLTYRNGSTLFDLGHPNALVVIGNFLEDQTTVESDANILLPELTSLSNSSWLLLRALPLLLQKTLSSYTSTDTTPVTVIEPTFRTFVSTGNIPMYITSNYELISGTVYSGLVIIGSASSLSFSWSASFVPIQFSQLNITGGTLIVNLNDIKYTDGSTIELFNYAAGEGQFSQILVVGAATSSCVQTKAVPQYQNTKVYLHLEIATSCVTANARPYRMFMFIK
jgi:hypothetical protein